jgi:hypothetical protein
MVARARLRASRSRAKLSMFARRAWNRHHVPSSGGRRPCAAPVVPGQPGRSRRGARVGRGGAGGNAWGLPLRERSCIRHHQVPKWTGTRPLIRSTAPNLYHRGFLDVSLASWGRACACGSCAHALSVGRVDRRSAPWVSGSGDGPRRAGRSSQPGHARRAAPHLLLRCFDIDLAHRGWRRDWVCWKGVGETGEPYRSASRRSGGQS